MMAKSQGPFFLYFLSGTHRSKETLIAELSPKEPHARVTISP